MEVRQIRPHVAITDDDHTLLYGRVRGRRCACDCHNRNDPFFGRHPEHPDCSGRSEDGCHLAVGTEGVLPADRDQLPLGVYPMSPACLTAQPGLIGKPHWNPAATATPPAKRPPTPSTATTAATAATARRTLTT
jgi:hypothetical protein